MAGLPIESLDELLRALGRERSLRGRLRVLGRAWKLLRALPPAEREKVALRLGSNWAWKRVEKSFLRDGELDETEQLVGRVFEQLGDADPGDLRELAALVRKGDRQGAQDLLLMTLQEALEEEAAEGEALHGDIETAAAEATPRDAPRDDVGLSVEDVMDARQSATAQAVRVDSPPEPPPVEAQVVDSAAAVLASALARPVAPSSEPAPPVEAPTPPRAAPVEQRPTPRPRELPASRPLEPIPTAGTGGADRLRVLRALDRRERAGAELGREGRARLVEALGGGWASRRALSRMIAAGALDDVAEALALIGRLTRTGQRIWCLADLVEHGRLDDDEVARVLDAAPTDAARRRLARRAQP